MSEYRVAPQTLDQMEMIWSGPRTDLTWPNVFVLPVWLQVWWRAFGGGGRPAVWTVSDSRHVLGIAPLRINDQVARFVGDPDVCDYQDFIVAPGDEAPFFDALFNHLQMAGVRLLELEALQKEASILRYQKNRRSPGFTCSQVDVTYEMHLPSSWEQYLNGLTGKHRHEVRRKMRRLNESGRIRFRRIDNASRTDVRQAIDVFLTLFRANRPDKAAFMTPVTTGYFRELAERTALSDVLSLHLLDINDRTVAAVVGFVFNRCFYLYNNGYDRRFQSLSVGFLSKMLTIKDSIKRGLDRYSFLKGDEPYKYRMGGNAQPLYRCRWQL